MTVLLPISRTFSRPNFPSWVHAARDAVQPYVQICSGYGSCDPLEGACDCWAGHTGADCSVCEPGYYRGATGQCLPDAPLRCLALTPMGHPRTLTQVAMRAMLPLACVLRATIVATAHLCHKLMAAAVSATKASLASSASCQSAPRAGQTSSVLAALLACSQAQVLAVQWATMARCLCWTGMVSAALTAWMFLESAEETASTSIAMATAVRCDGRRHNFCLPLAVYFAFALCSKPSVPDPSCSGQASPPNYVCRASCWMGCSVAAQVVRLIWCVAGPLHETRSRLDAFLSHLRQA